MAVQWQTLTAAQLDGLSRGADATYDFNGQGGSADALSQSAADLPLMAAADDPSVAVSMESTEDEPTSAECAAFAKDIDADLGEVLRAGCEPTLAQMSALIDNPGDCTTLAFSRPMRARMS